MYSESVQTSGGKSLQDKKIKIPKYPSRFEFFMCVHILLKEKSVILQQQVSWSDEDEIHAYFPRNKM